VGLNVTRGLAEKEKTGAYLRPAHLLHDKDHSRAAGRNGRNLRRTSKRVS
jgi:hypothetical protein